MSIAFTQFKRPNGRAVAAEITIDEEWDARAAHIIQRGLRFETEILQTGEVSLTVADHAEEEDIAIEIVPNGPEVIEGVKRLIVAAERHGLGL